MSNETIVPFTEEEIYHLQMLSIKLSNPDTTFAAEYTAHFYDPKRDYNLLLNVIERVERMANEVRKDVEKDV